MDDYSLAISVLNVERGRLAVVIHKWENEIDLHGPDDVFIKMRDSAKERFDKIHNAVKRLKKHDSQIIEENGICPHCKCPLDQCDSDHK